MYKIIFYIFIYIIVIIIIINSNMRNKNSLEKYLELELYNSYISKRKYLIVYRTFTGCGLGNKIPTIYSSIFFSIVSSSTFFIFGWKDMIKYFKIPLFILNDNISINKYKQIRIINNTIKDLLNYYKSISIYKYHGFMDIIYSLYKKSKIISTNKLSEKGWTRIIQKVFFKPCNVVEKYLSQFQNIKRDKKVIAVHIRTGFLSNLSKSSLWYSPSIYKKYKIVINELLIKFIHYRILILSDSDILIKEFTKTYSQYILNYSIPGPITNPHYSMHGSNYESGIKLLADNFLISKCDIGVGSSKSTYFSLSCSRSNINCIRV